MSSGISAGWILKTKNGKSNAWLPRVKTGNSGAFVPFDTFRELSPEIYRNDTKAYSRPVYEASPLNRITEQYGPGEDWHNNSKSVKTEYLTNNSGNTQLACAYYHVSGDSLVKSGNYGNAQLYVTKFTDEDGNVSCEFRDKLGQTVLTRQINGSNHDTYYVYDDFGNLRYVLPPEAADRLGANGTYSTSTAAVKNYCYYYKYDERRRCIEKKLPGCEPVYCKYDKADRLIFSQDGEQRLKGEWAFSLPDVFGRIVLTGICRNPVIHDNAVAKSTFVGNSESYYQTGYTNTGINFDPVKILSVNYYDNYRFRSLPGFSDALINYTVPSDFEDTRYGTDADPVKAKGLLTGTSAALLDNSGQFLNTTLYYDDRARMIQSKSNNHLNGYNKVYNRYDFTGNVTKQLKEHNIAGQSAVTELYRYSYDHAGRPLTTTYQINSKPAVTLVSNEYDELGRLEKKWRHNSTDSESFQYNIRNWLTKITSGGFEENLYYNTNLPVGTPCYNGNIAAMTWKYNSQQKVYYYYYDGLNRLTAAYKDDPLWPVYAEEFSYDKHGNITSLARTNQNAYYLDLLFLQYNGNRLTNVMDEYGNSNQYGIKEYHSENTNYNPNEIEFTYDSNGNMLSDKDRNISCIRYNFLNLPDTIQFGNGNQIINMYSADGRKLESAYFTLMNPVVVPLGQTQQWTYDP